MEETNGGDGMSLLPCPFCGGEAEMLTAESMHDGYLFGIMCNDCRSRGDVYDTEAEAIAAWNTRAERTCEDVHEPPKNTTFWPTPHFRCSECGAVHISLDYVHYCPNCGAKVVGE